MSSTERIRLRQLTHDARRALGVDDLLLVVHDASFPAESTEDVGRGTPYSMGARRLCEFADRLGFTGLQLGPQGLTTPGNRSPYDATVFSRSPLSICLPALHDDPAWEGLLDARSLEAAISGGPPAGGQVHHSYAERAHARAVDAAFERFRSHGSPGMHGRWRRFRQEATAWLEHDAAFEANANGSARADGGCSPAEIADRYAFAQFVVDGQHAAFRDRMREMGWRVCGDMQVGLSIRDRWRREHLFVRSYAMGAPPSRTNPRGQPWGYPLLLPGSADAGAFFRARVRKMAREYDGLRIDHPHGVVCPWAYRDAHHRPGHRGLTDPLVAVENGARLHESPDIPDHPLLAGYAIARPSQLNRSVQRFDDRWVTGLDDDQLLRYEERLLVIIDELSTLGPPHIACEVLSTAPYPLVKVLERRGLGRFRVTQKVNLDDGRDLYRSENALAPDWIMVGTHDTWPLAKLVGEWMRRGALDRAAYLAERLVPDPSQRQGWAQDVCRERARLTQAMFADLFASRARHVLVFMSDLFGLEEVYNEPGTVGDANWSLRVPNDFEEAYRTSLSRGTAMDVPGALALALRAKAETRTLFRELASELDTMSRFAIDASAGG